MILGLARTRALLARFASVEAKAESYRSYLALVREVDLRAAQLEHLHRPHLRCAPGCDSCCRVERTVLVVEAFHLWQEIRRMDPRSFRPHAAGRSCPLLVGRLCVAYAARPILCRTHGLPLLYRIEGQPSITFCELNFLDCPDEYFEPEQVLDMDVVNARLLEINTRFVAGELGLPVGRTDRVRLRTLLKAWERMRGASPPCRSGDRWEGL